MGGSLSEASVRAVTPGAENTFLSFPTMLDLDLSQTGLEGDVWDVLFLGHTPNLQSLSLSGNPRLTSIPLRFAALRGLSAKGIPGLGPGARPRRRSRSTPARRSSSTPP
jgi:hypothetical protein